MKILFTICGRAGSKGVKNKNIKPFLGKPLPYYTLSAIDLYLNKNENVEYDIVVNSDSKELLDIMKKSGIRDVDVIERSPELSLDTVGKIDVVRNCLQIMKKNKKYEYDMVVDLDITSPLRKEEDIEHLIAKHNKTGADITTSVVPARRNPFFNQLKRMENGYKKVCESNFTARQQAPEVYDMNASLYAYNPKFLMSGKHLLGGYVEIIEMYDTAVLDIDNENDMELMEVIAKYLIKNNLKFKEIYDNII